MVAHAPHRADGSRCSSGRGPVFDPLTAQPESSVRRPSNLLFYRYSPVGSYVAQPARLPLPH